MKFAPFPKWVGGYGGTCPLTLNAFSNCLFCRLLCIREFTVLWILYVSHCLPRLRRQSNGGYTSVLSDMSSGKPTMHKLLFANKWQTLS